VNRYKIVTIV